MRNMFRSARVKLTLFYLAALLTFSLSVTGTIRVLAEREYNRSNDVQRSEVRELFLKYFLGVDHPIKPETFYDVQAQEEELVRQHLNQELVVINVVALVLGGWLSYWFAGRTLKPIEEAHEAQARFASDASHELRTPLTNMRLENEVFLRQKQISEAEARHLIKSNLEEVQRLENLASSLLDLTRYGKEALELSPVTISTVVDEARKRVASQQKAKQATITQQLAAGKALGEYHSLVQLLGILLDNALKYGPVKGAVTITGKIENGQYVLEVCDEGPGIDEADLPFIFDRLYRGDKARSSKTGGYGLGLALAREIITANRGTIEAHNQKQGGARLRIQLNLVANA